MARPPAPAPAPSSFRHFNDLPPELRHQIWALTLSARIIDVHAFSKQLKPTEERNPLKDDRVYTSQRIIPILFVCRESREFALGMYKHSLDTESQTSDRFQARRDEFPPHIAASWHGCHFLCRKNSPSIPGEIRPRIYFNLETDVVCLNRVWWSVGRLPLYSIRNYFPNEFVLGMRYLALPIEMFGWALWNDQFAKASSNPRDKRVTLADFPNLREAIINIDGNEDVRADRDPDQMFQEITTGLEKFAARHPDWKMPKWRLVRDRASLGRVVERDLLT